MTATAAFQSTLASLNEEQRTAVEGVHGPWMVLAGPGTGKTHMLAARIGNILLKEQVEPRNILCLTFTNAGVKAMRDRLVRFMGAAGSRVAVHTFHDFARSVIEEYPALFDYTDWEAMDDLDKHRMINGIIDQLPPKHLMRGPAYEPYTFGPDLLWLFDNMTKEGWTAADVVSAAEEHILDLPNLKEFVYQRRSGDNQKGDLKPQAKTQEEKMQRLIAAANLHEDFITAKRERGLFDYADQITWLRDALSEHFDLRLMLQERFQFLLVDEYQDTNGIQNEILALLAEDEQPNLFVVGDDDQSIYGFQGARVEGLRELVERYSPLNFVVLKANYRSHQAILDAAQFAISENKNRLTEIAGNQLYKSLREATGFTERPMPRVISYPNPLAQAHYTAELIKSWLDEGVEANEIGVIYRKHAQAARLLEALELADVPYRLERSINVLEQPLIQRLHLCLAFLANLRSDKPVDEKQAFEFLMSPSIGITTTELFGVNGYKFLHNSRVPSWRYLLMKPEVLEGEEVPIANPERFRIAADLLNELGDLIDKKPLPTVVQQVAQRTGLLREALAGDESQLALECLDALIRDAHARIRKQPDLTLAGLCETWDELLAFAIPLSLVKQADTRPAVTLMTAHSAKGLEFDRVVMYEVTSGVWEGKPRNWRKLILPPQLIREERAEAAEEENRRLFYVALTRARQQVVLTVPAASETGRGLSPAVAVQVLIDEGLASTEEAQVHDEELYEGLAQQFGQQLAPPAPLLHAASAKTRFEDEDLTLGALMQFERCKVGFYYQYVSNSPRTPRALDRFRKTVHGTIHEFYRLAQRPDELEFMSEEELIALYHAKLGRERSGLSTTELEQYLEQGETILHNWYNCEDEDKRIDSLIERSIGLTTPDGLRLKGRIDRIDIDPVTKAPRPVDYKFGKPKAIDYGKGRGDSFRELKSREWRQLAYYALLIRDGMNGGSLPRSGKLIYLDVSGTEVVEVPFSDEAMKAFESELYDTYHAILECDDYRGCLHEPKTSERDKSRCSWCAFHYLKRNAVSLVSEEVAELDDL